MIDAARENGQSRSHRDRRVGKDRRAARVRFPVRDAGQAGRHSTAARNGRGDALDTGIYCINAARYLFQEEPLEVFAYTVSNGDPRFREVEEMCSAVLRFPQARLATFTAPRAGLLLGLSPERDRARALGP